MRIQTHIRNTIFFIASVAVIFSAFNGCQTTTKEIETESLWRNVYDTSVHYVGMQTCRTCHDAVYQTYIKTGMGQSFDYANREKSAADFSSEKALVYDTLLDFYYKPYWLQDTLYIKEYRLEGNDTTHKRIQKIDYIVGSGQHTNSHIFCVNGYFYQAPITFYSQKHKWDLAPGFEKGANSRFKRMIELECMSCHNGYSDFVDNSENKFTNVKTGIDCERCHGPGSLHVKEKMAGKVIDTSKTPDYSIVNPRRLSTELQNNVCQRCHLQGIATVNDGKTFFDFRPGMKLSEVMNVFMPQYEGAKDKMIMASHVERMKKSKCYLESNKLSCITCHNPHISVKYTEHKQYINACNSCHSNTKTQKTCTEGEQERTTFKNDCIECHMRRNGSIDIPHVAVTDHYIRKQPYKDTLQNKITAFLGMCCINNSKPDALTIARAYMEFFERYTPSSSLLDSALIYINKEKELEGVKKQNKDYIRLYYLLNNFGKVTEYAVQLKPVEIADAWTAYRIGDAFYKLQKVDIALPYYKRAIEIKKYSLDFENKYAICLLANNKIKEAFEVFTFILSQNPDNVSANTNMGNYYMQNGDLDKAYLYINKANAIDPDYEQNLINRAVWYHNKGQKENAAKCLKHLIKKHPDNLRAKAMLEKI